MNWKRRRLMRTSVAVLLTVSFLLLVLISPTGMQLLLGQRADWSALSEVGQAYGTASAFLSALAFCAIAISIVIQRQQTRVALVAVARQRHFDVVKLAIEDPSLLQATISGDPQEVRLFSYANLLVSHWFMIWDLGVLTDDRLRAALSGLFQSPFARRWWQKHGKGWASSNSRAEQRFVELVTEGWVNAVDSASEDQATVTAADAVAGEISKRRTTHAATAIIGTAGVVVVVVALRHKLRRVARS
jgi:hypothetical protein